MITTIYVPICPLAMGVMVVTSGSLVMFYLFFMHLVDTSTVFYLWVLHPVAHLSNWFLVMPSIATKFQYVNSPFFIFYFYSLHVSAPTGHPQVRYSKNSPWKHQLYISLEDGP
jgi:hypothetical protein